MKIPSFTFACKKLGYDPTKSLPDVSKMPKHMQASTVAKAKLDIIYEAARDGVELDYDDINQDKWGIWWWLNKPGFRFYVAFIDYSLATTTGGPRLCVLSREDAIYHANKHKALWKSATVIPKKKSKK
jgi:hypothetical protein